MILRHKIFIIFGLCVFVFTSLLGCRGCSRYKEDGVVIQEKRDYSNRKSVTNKKSDVVDNDEVEIIAPKSKVFSLQELFVNYKPAVFMVYTSDGEKGFQGSGFFVSADGIAISNYHVFKGTYKGLESIKTFDDKMLNIEKVLFQSEEDDYIIFKVRLNDNDRVKYISIAEQIPEIGEDVFAIGNPLGLEHTLSKGIISQYRDDQKLIQTTTEITHGSSGGPLINMKGEVVGITTSGAGEANINFAVNIKKLNLHRYL